MFCDISRLNSNSFTRIWASSSIPSISSSTSTRIAPNSLITYWISSPIRARSDLHAHSSGSKPDAFSNLATRPGSGTWTSHQDLHRISGGILGLDDPRASIPVLTSVVTDCRRSQSSGTCLGCSYCPDRNRTDPFAVSRRRQRQLSTGHCITLEDQNGLALAGISMFCLIPLKRFGARNTVLRKLRPRTSEKFFRLNISVNPGEGFEPSFVDYHSTVVDQTWTIPAQSGTRIRTMSSVRLQWTNQRSDNPELGFEPRISGLQNQCLCQLILAIPEQQLFDIRCLPGSYLFGSDRDKKLYTTFSRSDCLVGGSQWRRRA